MITFTLRQEQADITFFHFPFPALSLSVSLTATCGGSSNCGPGVLRSDARTDCHSPTCTYMGKGDQAPTAQAPFPPQWQVWVMFKGTPYIITTMCSCVIFQHHCRTRRLRIVILLLFIYRPSFGKLFVAAPIRFTRSEVAISSISP